MAMSVVVEIPLAAGAVVAALEGRTPAVEIVLVGRDRAVPGTGSGVVATGRRVVDAGTSRETWAVVAGSGEGKTRVRTLEVGTGATALLVVTRRMVEGATTTLVTLCVEVDILRTRWQEGKSEIEFLFVV